MSTYVWPDGLQSLRTGTEKDCLLSVGRKSFEHDLAARPAALDQRVSLLKLAALMAPNDSANVVWITLASTSSDTSETEIAQSRMIIRTASKRPMIFAI